MSERRQSFLSRAVESVHEYQGWEPDEIESNIEDLLTSGDTDRQITAVSRIREQLTEYEGWTDQQVIDNLHEVFGIDKNVSADMTAIRTNQPTRETNQTVTQRLEILSAEMEKPHFQAISTWLNEKTEQLSEYAPVFDSLSNLLTEFGERDPDFVHIFLQAAEAEETGDEDLLNEVRQQVERFGLDKYMELHSEYAQQVSTIMESPEYQQAISVYNELERGIEGAREEVDYIEKVMNEYMELSLNLPPASSQLLTSLGKIANLTLPGQFYRFNKHTYDSFMGAMRESNDIGDFKNVFVSRMSEFTDNFNLPSGADWLQATQAIIPAWNWVVRFNTEILKHPMANFRAAAFDLAYLTSNLDPEDREKLMEEHDIQYDTRWNPYLIFSEALSEATSSALAGLSNEMHIERLGASIGELIPAMKRHSVKLQPILDNYDSAIRSLERRQADLLSKAEEDDRFSRQAQIGYRPAIWGLKAYRFLTEIASTDHENIAVADILGLAMEAYTPDPTIKLASTANRGIRYMNMQRHINKSLESATLHHNHIDRILVEGMSHNHAVRARAFEDLISSLAESPFIQEATRSRIVANTNYAMRQLQVLYDGVIDLDLNKAAINSIVDGTELATSTKIALKHAFNQSQIDPAIARELQNIISEELKRVETLQAQRKVSRAMEGTRRIEEARAARATEELQAARAADEQARRAAAKADAAKLAKLEDDLRTMSQVIDENGMIKLVPDQQAILPRDLNTVSFGSKVIVPTERTGLRLSERLTHKAPVNQWRRLEDAREYGAKMDIGEIGPMEREISTLYHRVYNDPTLTFQERHEFVQRAQRLRAAVDSQPDHFRYKQNIEQMAPQEALMHNLENQWKLAYTSGAPKKHLQKIERELDEYISAVNREKGKPLTRTFVEEPAPPDFQKILQSTSSGQAPRLRFHDDYDALISIRDGKGVMGPGLPQNKQLQKLIDDGWAQVASEGTDFRVLELTPKGRSGFNAVNRTLLSTGVEVPRISLRAVRSLQETLNSLEQFAKEQKISKEMSRRINGHESFGVAGALFGMEFDEQGNFVGFDGSKFLLGLSLGLGGALAVSHSRRLSNAAKKFLSDPAEAAKYERVVKQYTTLWDNPRTLKEWEALTKDQQRTLTSLGVGADVRVTRGELGSYKTTGQIPDTLVKRIPAKYRSNYPEITDRVRALQGLNKAPAYSQALSDWSDVGAELGDYFRPITTLPQEIHMKEFMRTGDLDAYLRGIEKDGIQLSPFFKSMVSGGFLKNVWKDRNDLMLNMKRIDNDGALGAMWRQFFIPNQAAHLAGEEFKMLLHERLRVAKGSIRTGSQEARLAGVVSEFIPHQDLRAFLPTEVARKLKGEVPQMMRRQRKAVEEELSKATTRREKRTLRQTLREIDDDLEFLRLNRDKLNPDIINLARESRAMFDELFEQINRMRRSLGIQEIRLVEGGYVPHIRAENYFYKVGYDEALGYGQMYAEPIRTYNPRELARHTRIPWHERNHDILTLMERYIDGASKELFINPLVRNHRNIQKYIHDAGMGRKYGSIAGKDGGIDRYLEKAIFGKNHTRWIRDWISPEIGKAVDKAALTWSNWFARSAYSWNIPWSIRTQSSSLGLVPVHVGTRSFAWGLSNFMSPEQVKLTRQSYAYLTKNRGASAYYQDLSRHGQDLMKIDQTFFDHVDAFGSALTRGVENITAHISFSAFYRHFHQLGFRGPELLELASMGIYRTQSMYDTFNRPLVLNNPLIRAFFPAQTFSFQMFNLVTQELPRGLPGMNRAVAMSNLLAYPVATNAGWAALTGVGPWMLTGFFPYAAPVTEHVIKPLARDVGFSVEEVDRRAMPSFIGALGSTADSFVRFAKTGDARALTQPIRWVAPMFRIPAGIQISRMFDAGIVISRDGAVTSRDGRFLFRIDSDEYASALVGGVWATASGQEFLRRRGYGQFDFEGRFHSTIYEKVRGLGEETRGERRGFE